jgi:type I restriction enzyme S subunit
MKDFSRTEYKQVTVKPGYISFPIPSDWEVKKLLDISDRIENGLAYDTKIRTSGLPITRIETISNEQINDQKVGYLEEIDQKLQNRYRIRYGDILFSHINSLEHVGKTAIYKDYPTFLIHGMNLIRIVIKSLVADPFYILYSLKYEPTRNRFRAISNPAVNQVSINTTQLKKFEIVLPPLKEQQKIASILSKIDELIQKTDKIIEQTQRLQKGLTQWLLTKGLAHTKFKKSELGEFPEEWDFVKLQDVCLRIVKGIFDLSPDNYVLKGVPFIRISDIISNTIHLSNMKYIHEDINKKFPSSGLKSGDIVLAKVGASAGSTDKVAEIPDYVTKCNISQNLIGIKINHDKINSNFLFHLLHRQETMDKILSGSNTTTFKSIQLNILRDLVIPIPSKEEQQQIASIISNINELTQIQKRNKMQYDILKKGLMQKLLTGKIRVKV